ncbi:hypothetical protein B0H34DRAFT_707841 [Crassisporium funariophilum]|nr:hypothetical protein B0H34DRAFT_707841 [Crassisporium funariophilum]
MSSVVLRNMLFANLLQDVLSIAPRSSLREESLMPPQPALYRPTGIYSLPVELLTRIFVLGTGFDYPYTDSPFLLKPGQEYDPPPSSNFQVIVSHVCRHWRQVAVRTQSLWTTLHFRETSHISRAKTFLSRCSKSNTCLLGILVDTVAEEEHTPGITLYKDELCAIFQIIIPHVKRWQAFHLKICDNECKGQARQFLNTCGPAPNLETLQLYHFEDYRTAQRLYLATYRPPVVVFSNTLPRLKNVSLIGVNLPWEKSPYLRNLHSLELALHLDNIRPAYLWWDKMLRLSPELTNLCLHYSGPRQPTTDAALTWPDTHDKVRLNSLRELSLTDLDPDYLCDLMGRLFLPSVNKLSLDLPDQNFTPFIDLLTAPTAQSCNLSSMGNGLAPTSFTSPLTNGCPNVPILDLSRLETLKIHALECSVKSWCTLLRVLTRLRILEVDFTRVGAGFWEAFTAEHDSSLGLGTGNPMPNNRNETRTGSIPLPLLEVFKVSGVAGKDIIAAIRRRSKYLRGGRTQLESERWFVRWSERRRTKDSELDTLVDHGCWVPNCQDENATWIKITVESFDDEEEEAEEAEDSEESEVDSKDLDG